MAGLGVNLYDDGTLLGLDDQQDNGKLPGEYLDKDEPYTVEKIAAEYLNITQCVEAEKSNRLIETYHEKLARDQEEREKRISRKKEYPTCV